MAHWLLKNYHESVDVFLISFQEDLKKDSDNHFDYSSIFNFHVYLKTHPLLRRRHLTQHRAPSASSSTSVNSRPSFTRQVSLLKHSASSVTYQMQKSLCFHTACIHLYSGLPDIALEVLSMLPQEEENIENQLTDTSSLPSANANDEDMIVTGTFSGDLSTSVFSSNENSSFAISSENCNGSTSGWGGDGGDFGSTNRFADLDDGYQIGISLSDDDNDGSDTDNGDDEKKVDEQNEDESDEQSLMTIRDDNTTSDKAALNLKFRCVLQLLIEGLKALPSKCTLDKLKLRKTLKSMVRRELEYLHSICDYGKKNDYLQKYESSNESLHISFKSVKRFFTHRYYHKVEYIYKISLLNHTSVFCQSTSNIIIHFF